MAAAGGSQKADEEMEDEEVGNNVEIAPMLTEGPVLAYFIHTAEGSALAVPLRGASDAATCLHHEFGASDWNVTTAEAFFDAMPEMQPEGPYEYSWMTSKIRVALLTAAQFAWQQANQT